MPATYEPIATTTLGSAASSITFSSIPSTYTDLRVVFVGTSSQTSQWTIRLNGLSTSIYSFTYLIGNGTTASSGRFTNQTEFYANLSLNTTPALFTFDLFNYAGSSNKTALYTVSQDRNGSGESSQWVGLCRTTNAINQISIIANYGTSPDSYAIGTTATLYGIKAA